MYFAEIHNITALIHFRYMLKNVWRSRPEEKYKLWRFLPGRVGLGEIDLGRDRHPPGCRLVQDVDELWREFYVGLE